MPVSTTTLRPVFCGHVDRWQWTQKRLRDRALNGFDKKRSGLQQVLFATWIPLGECTDTQVLKVVMTSTCSDSYILTLGLPLPFALN